MDSKDRFFVLCTFVIFHFVPACDLAPALDAEYVPRFPILRRAKAMLEIRSNYHIVESGSCMFSITRGEQTRTFVCDMSSPQIFTLFRADSASANDKSQ
jgi:hypothetical protein